MTPSPLPVPAPDDDALAALEHHLRRRSRTHDFFDDQRLVDLLASVADALFALQAERKANREREASLRALLGTGIRETQKAIDGAARDDTMYRMVLAVRLQTYEECRDALDATDSSSQAGDDTR